MRRIVHYYPGAMGNSGVTFALWSWARAQVAAGYEVCVMHAPADTTGAEVSFVSKDECAGLSELASDVVVAADPTTCAKGALLDPALLALPP